MSVNRSAIPIRDRLKVIARRAMVQRGLLPDFSSAVLAETDVIATAAVETDPSIRDLRDLLWCSIDNDDSRDLDQLSVAEPMAGGAVRILVAVADVDAVVREESAIDGHARTNTTSVYTAAEIFPLLPEKLSTDLTSLGEGRERLAIVIEMDVAADGTTTESDVYRARQRGQGGAAGTEIGSRTPASRIGQRFDAIVTGAFEKGTWVRILQPAAEGKMVQGVHGLDVGDRVRVELVHTDVDRG